MAELRSRELPRWRGARVRLLVAWIYPNMAPLHQPPFDRLRGALGRKRLPDDSSAEPARGSLRR